MEVAALVCGLVSICLGLWLTAFTFALWLDQRGR